MSGKEITKVADGHFLLKDPLMDWDGNILPVSKVGNCSDVTRAPGEKKKNLEALIVSRETIINHFVDPWDVFLRGWRYKNTLKGQWGSIFIK